MKKQRKEMEKEEEERKTKWGKARPRFVENKKHKSSCAGVCEWGSVLHATWKGDVGKGDEGKTRWQCHCGYYNMWFHRECGSCTQQRECEERKILCTRTWKV